MVAASAVDHQQHPSAQTQSQPQTGVSAAAGTPSSNHPEFSTWLSERGVDQTKISTLPVTRAGYIIDTIVAAADISEGDVILRVPNDLIVTLKSVFEDEAVAELLTTGKLSELACLTLYLMYEKKEGKKSRWYHYIKELDKQRARGQQGAKSPLLWDEGQVEEYLRGSPVQQDVSARLEGIEKEYGELDTVWFMSGSLFDTYPYDTPTEAFSLKLFRQAFAAVQSSVVHLQGVPLSQRFALVPLGPPLLAYSPTAKATLRYDSEEEVVMLTSDRSYSKGDQILAWCGPQPNSKLLVNYGIVEDDNPHDRLTMTATIPNSDPLFKVKRAALQPAMAKLATRQLFNLTPTGLDPMLLPYLRLAHARTPEEVTAAADGVADIPTAKPLNDANESEALHHLAHYLFLRLDRYTSTDEEDEAAIADSSNNARKAVAARLLRIEKGILKVALKELQLLTGEDLGSLQQYSRLTSCIHSVKLA